jgi:hypothetical protein
MYPDAGGTCVKDNSPVEPMNVTSFQECVDAGGAVMESYPRQCRSEDGQIFIEEIVNENPELFTISGTVNYPSEFMPEMQVCAYNVLDDTDYTCTQDIVKLGMYIHILCNYQWEITM